MFYVKSNGKIGCFIKKEVNSDNYITYFYNHNSGSLYEKYEVEESSALEDLFDAFIVEYFNKKEVYKYISEVRNIFKMVLDGKIQNCKIFGAIWIEGNNNELILKSVSKMNNETGDFELL